MLKVANSQQCAESDDLKKTVPNFQAGNSPNKAETLKGFFAGKAPQDSKPKERTQAKQASLFSFMGKK